MLNISDVEDSKIRFWVAQTMLVSISQNNMFILLFLVCVSFDSWGWKIYISAVFCPFFGHFRSSGPSLLLSQAREVILMGPWTGNARKTGKTRRKCIFFVLRNQNSLKLKKVVYTTTYCIRRTVRRTDTFWYVETWNLHFLALNL